MCYEDEADWIAYLGMWHNIPLYSFVTSKFLAYPFPCSNMCSSLLRPCMNYVIYTKFSLNNFINSIVL